MRGGESIKPMTFNHGVLGSIPSALTKKIKHLRQNSKFRFKLVWAVCWQISCRAVTSCRRSSRSLARWRTACRLAAMMRSMTACPVDRQRTEAPQAGL
jgi:hypothetical protein